MPSIEVTLVIACWAVCILQFLIAVMEVASDAIDNYIADKMIGDVEALQGHLEATIYNGCFMKEPDYTIKIMGKVSELIVDNDQSAETVVQKWPEVNSLQLPLIILPLI